MNDFLDTALIYHAAGCAVISINQAKEPYYKFKKWFEQPQTEDELKEQLRKSVYGIAHLLYPASRYGILDFDGRHAEEAWNKTGIVLPRTAVDFTPHGYHATFLLSPSETLDFKRKIKVVKADCDCKDPENSTKPKPCGVDFLVNGYAVIPPTPGYRADPDHPFESAVVMPEAVLQLVRKNRKSSKNSNGNTDGSIPNGERKARLTSYAGTMRARGFSVEAIRAALQAENLHRCVPPIEQEHIDDILNSVNKWPEGAEIMKCTDLGNSQRLVRKFGPDLRYSFQSGWYVWDGKYWAKDEDGEVMRKAKETVREIHLEAAACVDNDLRKRLNDHAHNSEAKHKLDSMIILAQSEPGIPIHHTELDPDILLLNVANGTVDLRTGALRPHRREDIITRLVPITFDAEAQCPMWLQFLNRIMDEDPELIRFVQKAFGYTLTGSTEEQIFFVLHGVGANGKTTLISILQDLVGDYGRQIRTETLMVKKIESVSNDVARLAGARCVTATETEAGQRFAEGLLKQLTGGDKITARFFYREYFEFTPQCKIWISCNHKPRITGSDDAIWRRIRLIPFNVIIPPEERDPKLLRKLRNELSSILNWALEGALLRQREGLGKPKAVVDATDLYREESDNVGPFLDERCDLTPTWPISKTDLHTAYVDWCKKGGELAVTKKDFGLRLKAKGISEGRDSTKRYWLGVKLAEQMTNDAS